MINYNYKIISKLKYLILTKHKPACVSRQVCSASEIDMQKKLRLSGVKIVLMIG